ncbi:MAG TPA: flavin reductase family protein [Candidatus Sulfotelmatobacter sp.]|jgi:flavin reductase (DIM6/NTAB) family NADH-FMN oxidoreductase RutF
MHSHVSELPPRDLYNILLSSVAPRPIAWVSTINSEGQPNLAPFSFFNCVCVDPPLLAFAPGFRPSRNAGSEGAAVSTEAKDTLRNVRATGEFVVNVVTYDLIEAMNLTSGEYDPAINEFELAKVTPLPSKVVRPARVGESPVSFECKLRHILDFSNAAQGTSLVVGEVVALHVSDACLSSGRIDRDSLDLVGRMGGIQYSRTTNRIELARPGR